MQLIQFCQTFKKYKMKEFSNKKTDILKRNEAGEDIGNIHFAELAAITLNVAPKEGWTTDEMRKRLPLQGKMSPLKPDEKIVLENAEVDLLAACLKINWQMLHIGIIQYEDYILELQKSKDIKVVSADSKKK